MVEIQIKRTVMITPEIWEQIRPWVNDGEERAGLTEFRQFWDAVSKLPAESWPFFTMPWTDADSHRIGLMPFAEIAKITDQKCWWRVDGSASAGYTGFINVGGQERRFDMSLSAMPSFYETVALTEAQVDLDVAAGRIDANEEQTIREFCRAMRQDGERCGNAIREMNEIQKEREKSNREKREADSRQRDRENSGKSREGDFGRDFGGKFGGAA